MSGNRVRGLAGAVRWLLLAALAFGLVRGASAQDRVRGDRSRTAPAVLRVFKPVVAEVARSTVRIVSPGDEQKELALGVIVSRDGYIVTKGTELQKEISCRLSDGRLLAAERVGVNAELDLAMLKVDAGDLPAIDWAPSEASVGQWLATVSTGELPAAVGVVSVKTRAIPRERATLGVAVIEVEKGVKIQEVTAGSGALKAGLKAGDVIFEVAGKVVRNGTELRDRITSFRIGDSIVVRVLREEASVEVQATLGHAPPESNRGAFQNQLGGDLSLRRDGFPSAFQHDTVLRPEDCGGPVVGLDGKAIGLNIARAGRTESYALPASAVITAIDAMRREASTRVSTSAEVKKDDAKPSP